MRKIALIILLSKRAMHILGNDSLSGHRKNYGNSEIKKKFYMDLYIVDRDPLLIWRNGCSFLGSFKKFFLCCNYTFPYSSARIFLDSIFFCFIRGLLALKWWKLTDLSGNVQLKWLVHFDLLSINLQYFTSWRTAFLFICKLISGKWKYVAPSCG